MSDATTTRICNECGLAYRESLLPHQCAEWTKGRTEQPSTTEASDHDEPPAPRAGERERVEHWNAITDEHGNSDVYGYGVRRICRATSIELAEQITTEHNQHAALVEQRDRLVEALRQLMIRFEQTGEAWMSDPTMNSARELLTTIEQSGKKAGEENGNDAVEQLLATQSKLIEVLKEAMKVVSDRAAGGRMVTTTEEASEIWGRCAKAIFDAQKVTATTTEPERET